MKKYCISNTCLDQYHSKRKANPKSKLPKVVPDSVLECPDCGEMLRIMKMHKTRGKMTRDMDKF